MKHGFSSNYDHAHGKRGAWHPNLRLSTDNALVHCGGEYVRRSSFPANAVGEGFLDALREENGDHEQGLI